MLMFSSLFIKTIKFAGNTNYIFYQRKVRELPLDDSEQRYKIACRPNSSVVNNNVRNSNYLLVEATQI